jgi:hypothetical protein
VRDDGAELAGGDGIGLDDGESLVSWHDHLYGVTSEQ